MTTPAPQNPPVKIIVPQEIQTGKYANAFTVTVGEREIIVDFGYILPNVQPTTIEVVSRINMQADAAKTFLSTFQNTLLDFENARKHPKE
jgi:hypothetical protein